MRGSLRLQLLAWVLVPLACLAAVNAATGYRHARQAADLVTDRMLIGSARAIAEATRSEEGQLQAAVPPAALEMFDTGRATSSTTASSTAPAASSPAPPTCRCRPDGPEDVDSYEVDYRGRPMRFYALDHALAGPGPAGPSRSWWRRRSAGATRWCGASGSAASPRAWPCSGRPGSSWSSG